MSKISVIVPVYKVEKYLSQCVDSVFAQTITDWELILVDDGSPDRSGAICDEYAAIDQRVKVIHKPNGGVSSARNLGIELASGEWLCFLDSDDWFCETYLEDFGIEEDKSDVDLYMQGFHIIDKNCVTKQGVLDYKVNVIEGAERSNILNSACYKLYRKKIIDENKLFFIVGCSYGEDHLFTLKYLSIINFRTKYVAKHGYNYRRDTEESLTRRIVPVDNLLFYISEVGPLLKSILFKYNVDEKEVARLINNRLVDQSILAIKYFFSTNDYFLVDYKNMIHSISESIWSFQYVPTKYTIFIKTLIYLPPVISCRIGKIMTKFFATI